MNANLYDALTASFSESSGSFIQTPAGDTYTYEEALQLTEQIAGALAAMQIEPGNRIAVQVDKSPEALLLYLACLKIGAVYLPLNTGYTAVEIGYFLGDAEPALFICRPKDEASGRQVAHDAGCPQVHTLGTARDGSLFEAVRNSERLIDTVPRSDEDLAAILYTSGTTGRSKGAMLTHANLRSNGSRLMAAWRFGPKDRLIHALPIYHTHGLFVACNVVMLAGASLYFMPQFDLDDIISQIPQGTALMGVPTFYTRLLQDERLDENLCRSMRLFTSGSAPLTAETHSEFSQRTGHAILERYGMTETNMNTSNPYDGERRAGTVGFPLDGTEIRITSGDSHEALARGDIGMIEVRGPNVFSGYWRMPEKTAEELLEDGFFVTGDLGQFDENGYLQIVGREKDLVISGGFNVYPKEIEQVIDEHEAVLESAVFGVTHPDFGEGVTAAVVLKVPAQKLDRLEQDIQSSLASRLAKYKQPKRILVVDALPRNTMGKVQKNQLRKKYAGLYGGA